MSNTTTVWTPFAIQRVATENGWDSKEYHTCDGTAASFGVGLGPRFVFTKAATETHCRATVHVAYTPRGGVTSAWLHLRRPDDAPWSGGEWFMLDGKVSGKRDIVIRWLAGDFTAGSQYALQ